MAAGGGRVRPPGRIAAVDSLTGHTFIGQHGHVLYGRLASKSQDWRVRYINNARCEFSVDCAGATLVFDHCHEHGWVRGVLCNSHNVKMGYIDVVSRTEGITVDLGDTPYGQWAMRCPDCAEIDISKRLPFSNDFASIPEEREKGRRARLKSAGLHDRHVMSLEGQCIWPNCGQKIFT